MSGGHWLHTVWKFACAPGVFPNPMLPFYSTQGVLLQELSASSASDLTVVRTRYDINLMGSIVMDAAGKTGGSAAWWNDLCPVYRVYNQVSAPPPFESPFGVAGGETDGTADGMLKLVGEFDNIDQATGHRVQTVAWGASGNTEGMRRFPGPGSVSTVAVWGMDYNSFAAGYLGSFPNVTWYWSVYLKTLFGSATTIT